MNVVRSEEEGDEDNMGVLESYYDHKQRGINVV